MAKRNAMETESRTDEGWGIEPGYMDALDRWRDTPQAAIRAVRSAMGLSRDEEALPEAIPLRTAAQGGTEDWPEATAIALEDRSVRRLDGSLPADLPSGFHRVLADTSHHGAGERLRHPIARLLVHPRRCPHPPSQRAWGWAVQLYSLRSRTSWGIGDFADLRRLGEWSARLGAGFLQVNPLMPAQPAPPIEASPYYPSSRRFLNPLYLSIDEVPGAKETAGLEAVAAAGRALNGKEHIDRDAIFRSKHAALEILWKRSPARRSADGGHAAFLAASGTALLQYAAYCILAEAHGPDWRRWPEEFRHPESPAVERFARKNADRLAFHQWLQWLLDVQLRNASRAIPLIQDLPIGFDPGGADAWAWQDLLAFDASVGAPPDEFNPRGQDWGLPPFIPHRLRDADYLPLRQTLRSILRHAGGLRVDHIMGFFRLYWIPRGAPASEGAYVRLPHRELLAVLAVECERAGAFVIGEDLGTVEPMVREAMAEWGILGSKVLWFESDPPSGFPKATFASLSTHDLPTLAGQWSGRDEAEQKALGLPVDPESMRPALDRIRVRAGIRDGSGAGEIARRVHGLLAQSASMLVAAALEDALGVERRPNLPGTITERPNWRIPLPKSLEEIETDPLALDIAAVLDRRA